MLAIIAKSNFIKKKKKQAAIITNLKNKKVMFKKPKYKHHKKIKYIKAGY